MIDVKQFKKGELVKTDGNYMVWNGKKCAVNPMNPLNTPWEFEAHRDDGQLAKRLIEMPGRRLLAKRSRK